MKQIALYCSLIKFSHSIFALPFALSMAVIATRYAPLSYSLFLALLLAIVSARTAAMAFNRILDAKFDSKNPRTKGREIPTGQVSLKEASAITFLSSVLFIFAASLCGKHCLILAPLVLALLLGYSWTKRFTSLSHLVLGLCLAIAPGGVWYAMVGTVSIEPIPLMFAVLFWVTGFDILYSCQDVKFDRDQDLQSVPKKFGIKSAFFLARSSHLLSATMLLLFGIVNSLGVYYFLGLFAFLAFLLWQHHLVKDNDLSKIDQAFFTANGTASILFFIGVLLDVRLA